MILGNHNCWSWLFADPGSFVFFIIFMDVAKLLCAAHRSMHLHEITQRLGRFVARAELEQCQALVLVDKDTWKYNRQWQHVVDKESMCLLLQGSTAGIAAGDLRQCYADATYDVDALVKDGFVTVMDGDKLFYSHPEFLLPISEDLLHKWHAVQPKEETTQAPALLVTLQKKQKRSKCDKHNSHVTELW